MIECNGKTLTTIWLNVKDGFLRFSPSYRTIRSYHKASDRKSDSTSVTFLASNHGAFDERPYNHRAIGTEMC